ncbi:MAG: glycosyltransferase [Gomphosphaeria aponina SAG 52.96 = DSM 107014]|uniref:Glycosyltransferase n=1 Tax=Gomphosphaeria aponina SAG 52.96 = DSM 107014 TaxID=1521640 RepID=A0A941GRK0_9CHRO|nr:glycosyltransferase [Gomphosphaeria aponina SAG 52.96 = DSM 107014]
MRQIGGKILRRIKRVFTPSPTPPTTPAQLRKCQQLLELRSQMELVTPPIPRPGKKVISVVIGSYNRRRLLEKAINSVRHNQIPVPYEIIVVDGGSDDGSLAWLIQQKDIITIVQHNRGEFQGKTIERQSWGYFMNLGFKSAQGKYILMISDDCLLLPNAVNLGLEKFQEMETAGRKIGGVAFYFRNWPEEKEYYVQKSLGGKLAINHGIYLKEALEAVGWLEEDQYIFYKADSDVCLKMWLAGYEIVDCPKAFVEHYYDPEEAVRQSNNAVKISDREVYLKRWDSIYYHPTWQELRDKIIIKYDDPHRTAEQFLE